MLKHMEIAEQVYKGVTPSKTTTRAYAKSSNRGRKCKGGEDAYPTNPRKGRAGKFKKNYAGHSSDQTTGDKICLVHFPRHSTEECKVLKEYTKKYAVRKPYKDKEAYCGGNKNSGKIVKLDGETQEVNTMVYHDAPIPRKKKGKNKKKKHKSDQANSDPSEDWSTYGIDHMNLGKPENESESDSRWLLAQGREGYTTKKN